MYFRYFADKRRRANANTLCKSQMASFLVLLLVAIVGACQSASLESVEPVVPKELTREQFRVAIDERLENSFAAWRRCIESEIAKKRNVNRIGWTNRENWIFAGQIVAMCDNFNQRYSNLLLQKANNFPNEGRYEYGINIESARMQLLHSAAQIELLLRSELHLESRLMCSEGALTTATNRCSYVVVQPEFNAFGQHFDMKTNPERRYVLD